MKNTSSENVGYDGVKASREAEGWLSANTVQTSAFCCKMAQHELKNSKNLDLLLGSRRSTKVFCRPIHNLKFT